MGTLAAAVWYVVARDTPEQHAWVSREELAMIAQGRGDIKREAALAEEERKAGVPWMQIFSSKEVLALMASYFTFGYISWIFFSWFYIYLAQVRGLSLKTSAVYSIFPFMAMTVGSLLGGAASDWLARVWSPRVGRCYSAGIRTGDHRTSAPGGIKGAECDGRNRSAGVRSRRSLCVTKFVLVGDRGLCWGICRSGFKHREYELPDWRGGHGFVDAVDCSSFWMGGVVLYGDFAGDAGSSGVAGGQPRSATGALNLCTTAHQQRKRQP